MEDLFVPLAVHNNKKGRDAELLKKYGEPSWNYPVMRFFAGTGGEVIPRRDQVWSPQAVGSRMMTALKAAKRERPSYLKMAVSEFAHSKLERATFAMHCYWVGEARFGGLDGVYATRSGWLGGLEVVEVEFDPKQVSYQKLVTTAFAMECAQKVFARTDAQLQVAAKIVGERATLSTDKVKDAKASDQMYHLKRTVLRHLPLTPMQQCRVNSAIERGGDPKQWLSPRQQAAAAQLKKLPDAARASLKLPRRRSDVVAAQKRLEKVLASTTQASR